MFKKLLFCSIALVMPLVTNYRVIQFENTTILNNAINKTLNVEVFEYDESISSFHILENYTGSKTNLEKNEKNINLSSEFIKKEISVNSRWIIDDDTFVRIATANLNDAYNYDQGIVMIPDAGIKAHAYRDSSQENVDKFNIGIMVHTSSPSRFGAAQGSVSIAAHNGRGPFGKLGKAKIGSKIYIDSGYAQFIYQITEIHYGDFGDGTTTGFTIDNGERTLRDIELSGQNRLVLFTCYPFNKAVTQGRYVVFAQLIKGTELK